MARDVTSGAVASTVPPRDKKGQRTGYTTGACAAAASKAATLGLLRQAPIDRVAIELPSRFQQEATFPPIEWRITVEEARCGVIKDAGDDPDVTHGALICATATWKANPGLEIAGGEGVGVVTRPGLGLEIGGPAINRVPRRMITASVETAAGALLSHHGLRISISVPGGEGIAEKTLNPRLGILGGISILGTTGIVQPYSTTAWRASVVQNINVATANDCWEIVLSTGGQSEAFARQLWPHLPELAFVDMGIFTGDALRACARRGVRRAILCGMVGKFAKLAQGHLQTHVAGNRVDAHFLAEVAARVRAPLSVQEEIRRANSARHFAEIALAYGITDVFPLLCELVCEHGFAHVQGTLVVEAVLFGFDGRVLGQAEHGAVRGGACLR
jgi:cobalt-precorrin-5B (C1)-methyltransferase